MKKTLLFAALGCVAAGMASAAEPVILPEFYSITISPDGRWLISDGSTGSLIIYDVTTGQGYEYPEVTQGNGNCITNSGTLVGSSGETGVVIRNGEMVYLSEDGGDIGYLNGITPDGKRIVATIGNPENEDGYDGRWLLPAYYDVAEDGTISEPHVLPVPETDLFGLSAQYCSAVWISDDGKTILGQEIDNRGNFISPIVYTQDEAGEWSWSRPTEALFNPNHIEMPEDPGEFGLEPPTPYDYMTEEEIAAYQEAYQEWIDSGYELPYPYMGDFMSPEELEAYNAAADEYNQIAQEYNDRFDAYFSTIAEIIDSSVNFLQNSMVLAADGKSFIMTSIAAEGEGWDMTEVYSNYQFDVATGDYTIIPSTIDRKIMATQLVRDGIVIGVTPMSFFGGNPPCTYVYVPGAEDFVPLKDFLATNNPELADWIDENLTVQVEVDFDPETYDPIYEDMTLTGHAVVNYDFNTVSGGMLAYMFYDGPMADNTFASYLFTDVKYAPSSVGVVTAGGSATVVKALRGGVLLIDGEATDIEITDIAGRKLFNASSVNGRIDTGLASGVYVVRAGETVVKVAF